MKLLFLLTASFVLASCQHSEQHSKPDRHYALTGKVVSINAEHQTATIDAAAIPNYMEAMTMEYPVQSKADLAAMKVGERITATVDVTPDESYSLSHVKAAQ